MSTKPQLVLHIGTMKSGTTYLQNGLLSRTEELESTNWLYPMKFAPARGAINHERACYGLVGNHIPWVDATTQKQMQPLWEKLSNEISNTNQNVLLSAEALAAMLEDGIELLLESLPERDIRIVITARDLARVLPSSWQQSVRNGRPFGYQEYFERIKRAAELPVRESVGSNFWRSYNLTEVINRWQKFFDLGKITFVTVPQSQNSDSLWKRFITAINLPIDPAEPKFNDKQAHTAITWPEAEVLNELNQKWAKQLKTKKNRNQIRRRIVQEGFQARSERGRTIGLTQAWLEFAHSWADQDVAGLVELGVRIHGDINDLRVDPQLLPVEPCSAAEIAEARAVADRFLNRIRMQSVANLFGITKRHR
ncbi:MAG: hypothetical protein FJW76_00840 [Actinobacteria bacterium]|nr:hypothetical protein [Actinomycetota bacterium]